MIINPEKLRIFEENFIRADKSLTYKNSLNIFTSMWKEAVSFGILPPDNPMEGIETDIRIAKILNSCLKKFSPK